MAIWSTEAPTGELTIKIQGRFDFSAHQEFRDAYEKATDGPKGYVVDMKETNPKQMILLIRFIQLVSICILTQHIN
jgi:hypothetical protein